MREISPKEVAYVNGCSDNLIIPKLEKQHLDLKDELMSVYDEECSMLELVKKKVALRQCRVVLSKLLKMHNVFQLDKKGLYEFLHSIDLNENNLTVENLLSVYDKIDSFSTYVNPYDLKVTFVKSDNLIEGELISSVYDTIKDGEIETVFSFDKIKLGNICTIVTPCVYAHELTHSQLQSNRGIVKYYENLECLSYFVELVVALELSEDDEILKLMEKFIKVELIKLISELECFNDKDNLYDTGKYLISTIKALKLFILYFRGSSFMRLDMLSKVQKVLDGELYLEELLDSYSIDSKINKELVKYLTR